ncbi:biotin--[acetyl-CoA-carboxylase] ligase [Salinibacterium sp. SYSU T00001]|uniref:biotin--[acetyl-CoA-carboxylase] ligase n=1 Tax=Homoserinimonas sedimenticola TaxID=2986805 RepID=UPI002235E668|nr:biotin--[acetyl-CoA-carboxylase] ligase [Salinibacterium sedimenticola]MCW4385090.1 biotin--[acetyl-CoA-carboxylase] ligase [Salinibacterium sedimenticola]
MLLPLSAPHATRIDFLPECPSTNSELIDRAAAGAPHFSVVATDTQTAGRGRLGRTWVAPPGRTLAASVLLRPDFPADAWGWLPLVAGLAMARAVREVLPLEDGGLVTVKWPNDVLVRDKKISGLLAEIVPGADAAALVVGAGLNLSIPSAELPTDSSTSLTLEGAAEPELLDRALAAYLRELGSLYAALQAYRGDAEASGIRRAVSEECATLGRRVRVTLPSDETVMAIALEIDAEGRLVIERDGVDGRGAREAVSAGDVTHVRYE